MSKSGEITEPNFGPLPSTHLCAAYWTIAYGAAEGQTARAKRIESRFREAGVCLNREGVICISDSFVAALFGSTPFRLCFSSSRTSKVSSTGQKLVFRIYPRSLQAAAQIRVIEWAFESACGNVSCASWFALTWGLRSSLAGMAAALNQDRTLQSKVFPRIRSTQVRCWPLTGHEPHDGDGL
jgi:hypothetical protein